MISIFLLHINSLMLYREEDEEEVDLHTIKFPKSVVNCNYKSIGNYISFYNSYKKGPTLAKTIVTCILSCGCCYLVYGEWRWIVCGLIIAGILSILGLAQ
mgnify:CR=1 FL=1